MTVCGVDTKEERNALMERVYPKLSEFCRDKYGLEFQVRSGVYFTDTAVFTAVTALLFVALCHLC